jgi:hypothetical protein
MNLVTESVPHDLHSSALVFVRQLTQPQTETVRHEVLHERGD